MPKCPTKVSDSTIICPSLYLIVWQINKLIRDPFLDRNRRPFYSFEFGCCGRSFHLDQHFERRVYVIPLLQFFLNFDVETAFSRWWPSPCTVQSSVGHVDICRTRKLRILMTPRGRNNKYILLLMMRAIVSSSSNRKRKRPPALTSSSPLVHTILGLGRKPLNLLPTAAELPCPSCPSWCAGRFRLSQKMVDGSCLYHPIGVRLVSCDPMRSNSDLGRWARRCKRFCRCWWPRRTCTIRRLPAWRAGRPRPGCPPRPGRRLWIFPRDRRSRRPCTTGTRVSLPAPTGPGWPANWKRPFRLLRRFAPISLRV